MAVVTCNLSEPNLMITETLAPVARPHARTLGRR